MLLLLVAILSQAPAKPTPKIVVIKGNSKRLTVKKPVEFESENRARCDDACQAAADQRAKELAAKEDAVRRRERDVSEREADMKRREDEAREEQERQEQRRTEQKKSAERHGRQLEQMMQGIDSALAGE